MAMCRTCGSSGGALAAESSVPIFGGNASGRLCGHTHAARANGSPPSRLALHRRVMGQDALDESFDLLVRQSRSCLVAEDGLR
jgi:hypothetical protein